ncbi:MAG: hypothetical protein M3Y33_10415, partial [Actinomycetota bacterium]|nr:hypothetical protein [Actinomycetota bacterium]
MRRRLADVAAQVGVSGILALGAIRAVRRMGLDVPAADDHPAAHRRDGPGDDRPGVMTPGQQS